jgi:hypothetical protein
MRTYLCLVTLVISFAGATAFAGHSRIVVMADSTQSDALRGALQVALAGRGVAIESLPAPDGTLRLDRAANVQRTTRASNADAGIWIEQEPGAAEVYVVSSDGQQFRHAPLPADAAGVSPRMFAAITTSLLDEILAPPEPQMPSINVDVHVDVGPGASSPPPRPAAPISNAPVSVAASTDPIRSNHALVEIGPTLSPVSVGLEGEIAFPIAPSLRFGLVGTVGRLLAGVNDMVAGSRLLGLGGELRYVGGGSTHFDFGLLAGIANGSSTLIGGDSGGVAAARFAVVWEGKASGVELSLSPTLLLGFRGNHGVLPGVVAALRWEFAL